MQLLKNTCIGPKVTVGRYSEMTGKMKSYKKEKDNAIFDVGREWELPENTGKSLKYLK